MKVLSVQNPFSWYICSGAQVVDNRSWKTTHRGKILIHSCGMDNRKIFEEMPYQISQAFLNYLKTNTVNYDECDMETIKKLLKMYNLNKNLLSGTKKGLLRSGYIIGSVDLIDVTAMKLNSSWANRNKYNWVLSNPKILKSPIPTKGSLGIWEVDDDLLEYAEFISFNDLHLASDKKILEFVSEKSMETSVANDNYSPLSKERKIIVSTG